MRTESESHPEPEGVVCPKCLLANSPTVAFCADCGAPIGMVASIDPLQHILAEGFAYRSAVDGPPNLIVLIGMWLLFAPVAFVAPFLLFSGCVEDFPPRLFFLLLGACSLVVLYRSTKNYLIKTRATKDKNA